MLESGTNPESCITEYTLYITEYTLVYEENYRGVLCVESEEDGLLQREGACHVDPT